MPNFLQCGPAFHHWLLQKTAAYLINVNHSNRHTRCCVLRTIDAALARYQSINVYLNLVKLYQKSRGQLCVADLYTQSGREEKEGEFTAVAPSTPEPYQSQYHPQTSCVRRADKSLWSVTLVNWRKVASKESSDLPAFNNSLNFWIDSDSFISDISPANY